MSWYKRLCNTCGKYYEGQGKYYCCHKCQPSPMKNKHHKQSTINKIKETKKIIPVWNKGLTKLTDKRVKKNGENIKISWSKKSEEEMKIISKNISDRTISEKERKRRSESRKKQIPPMLGKHQTDYQKKKLKEIRIGKTYEEIYGVEKAKEVCDKISENHADTSGEKNGMFNIHMCRKDAPMYDKKHTQSSKDKMSKSHIGKRCGEDNNLFGKPKARGAGVGKGAYYNSPLQGQVWTGSSWERLYAQYLEINNIPYMYEDKFYHVIVNNRKSTYRPDFRLYPDTEQEEFIDVKGWEQWNKEKIICFKEQYPNIKFKVLFFNDLNKLGINFKNKIVENKNE